MLQSAGDEGPRTRDSWIERLLPGAYLSRQSGEDADVMPQRDDGVPVAEHPLERSAS